MRRFIDWAVGYIAELHKVCPDAAFELLREGGAAAQRHFADGPPVVGQLTRDPAVIERPAGVVPPLLTVGQRRAGSAGRGVGRRRQWHACVGDAQLGADEGLRCE